MKKLKQIGLYMLSVALIAEIVWIPQSVMKAAAKISQSKAVSSAQKYLDKNVEHKGYCELNYSWFQDVDMDGELELIIESPGGSMRNYPKAFCKIKSNGSLEGIGETEAEDLNLYYNKKTKKYVYLTVGRYKDGVDAGNNDICELVNKNGQLNEKILFSNEYKQNETYTKEINTYYVNKKKVSKSIYKKKLNAYMHNLQKIKVKTKIIDLSKWKSKSKQEKKNLLNKSYKAFSYKK